MPRRDPGRARARPRRGGPARSSRPQALEAERSVGVDPAPPAGCQPYARAVLYDERGTTLAPAQGKRLAPPHRDVPRPRRRPRARRPPRPRAPARGRRAHRAARGHAPAHFDRHDLDRALALGVPVAALVRGVEALLQIGAPRHRELVRLPLVAELAPALEPGCPGVRSERVSHGTLERLPARLERAGLARRPQHGKGTLVAALGAD